MWSWASHFTYSASFLSPVFKVSSVAGAEAESVGRKEAHSLRTEELDSTSQNLPTSLQAWFTAPTPHIGGAVSSVVLYVQNSGRSCHHSHRPLFKMNFTCALFLGACSSHFTLGQARCLGRAWQSLRPAKGNDLTFSF